MELEFSIPEHYIIKIQWDSVKSIDIELINSDSGKALCEIELIALWLNKPKLTVTIDDFHFFNEGDYMQNNFHSHPPQKGYGTILHKGIIENIREYKNSVNIQGIYSTRFEDDMFSEFSRAYWESKVKKKLAEKNESIGRYKLIF